MKNLNNIIKILRIENNLIQNDVAKALKVPKNTYGAWERGDNEPPVEIIKKLADFYKVTADYLIGREEEDGRIIIKELELPNDEKRILEKYRNLSPELKAVSYEYIKSLNNLNEEFNNRTNKYKTGEIKHD